MNRIQCLILTCLFVSISFGQNTTSKVYKSIKGSISFTYPSYLVQQKIDNAPHMLLKLESNNYALSISFWEYNFDNSISIWDEVIVSTYSRIDKNIPNSKVHKSCEKIYLTIANNKQVKCLKTVMRTTNSLQGQTIKFDQVYYRLLHKGNYLQFGFFVFSYHDYWNRPQFSDDIMKGLKLL